MSSTIIMRIIDAEGVEQARGPLVADLWTEVERRTETPAAVLREIGWKAEPVPG